MSWLKWSGSRWIPSLSAGTKDALCLSLKKGQPLLPLEQSYCFSSARSTCCHISFKGTFSDSWKLGKCSDEMLLFIMKASLRSLYFRACARSLFLFCNSISNTSFSKQQLTLISMWNWLAPGSLTSERLSYAVPCSLAWVEGEGGICFFLVGWGVWVYSEFGMEGTIIRLWNQAGLGVLQLVVLLLFPRNEAVLMGLWGTRRDREVVVLWQKTGEEISKVVSACGFAFTIWEIVFLRH